MLRPHVVLGLMLSLAIAPMVASAADQDCLLTRDPAWLDHQLGRTVTLRGRYAWNIHYQTITPDGCGDAVLFVALSAPAADQLQQHLGRTYPGANFGGGWVSGEFTGKVTRNGRTDVPYLRVVRLTVDPDPKMQLPPPTK